MCGKSSSIDERRVRNFKNNLCLTFDKQEALSNKNLSVNMLSITPDDRPIVGSLKQHPNVFVNVGHGQRSTALAFVCGKTLADVMMGKAEAKELSARRFMV